MDNLRRELLAKPTGTLATLHAELRDIMSSISASGPKRQKTHRVDTSTALSVSAISLSARAEKLLVGTEGVAKMVNLKTGEIERVFAGSDEVRAVSLNFQGNCLAMAIAPSVRLLHTEAAGWHQDFTGHEADVTSICLNIRNTRIFTGSSDHTARMWDTRTAECMVIYHGHEDAVRKVMANLFETRVFTASADGTARCYDMRNGECLAVYRGHLAGINDLDVSLDGRLLSTASDDHTLKIWDVEREKCVKTILSPSVPCVLKLSSDGRFAVAGGDDGVVRLWDIKTGNCVRRYEGHSLKITAMDMSRSQRLLATASSDQTVRLWDFDTAELLATFYNLNEGFLWTTPSDEVAPHGWLWTNSLTAVEVLECDEDGNNARELADLERKEYFAMYLNDRMVMTRIHDYPEYQRMLKHDTNMELSKFWELQLERERRIKRLTATKGETP